MIINLNNYIYLSILFLFVTLMFLYKLLRQKRRSEVNIHKMIKELEAKLIKV